MILNDLPIELKAWHEYWPKSVSDLTETEWIDVNEFWFSILFAGVLSNLMSLLLKSHEMPDTFGFELTSQINFTVSFKLT